MFPSRGNLLMLGSLLTIPLLAVAASDIGSCATNPMSCTSGADIPERTEDEVELEEDEEVSLQTVQLLQKQSEHQSVGLEPNKTIGMPDFEEIMAGLEPNDIIRMKSDSNEVSTMLDSTSAQSSNAGKWELIAKQRPNVEFDSNSRSTFLMNEGNPDAGAYMKIGQLDQESVSLKLEGKYQFKLIYDGSTKLEWKQSSWLTSSVVEGLECISPDNCEGTSFPYGKTCSGFKGLGKSDTEVAILDGNGGSPCWFNSVGVIKLNHGYAMPAWSGGWARRMELFIWRNNCQGPITRTRYLAPSADTLASCVAESQSRVCSHGTWDSWSGSYTHASCRAWDLIAKQVSPAPFDSNSQNTYLMNEDNPEANAYMKIGQLDQEALKDEGKYHLKLIYENKYTNGQHSSTVEWKQSSWLTSSVIEGLECTSPTNCEGTSFPHGQTCDGFEGLGKSEYAGVALLDGNGGSPCWFNSVGVIKLNHGYGMPAWSGGWATKMELFIWTKSS